MYIRLAALVYMVGELASLPQEIRGDFSTTDGGRGL